MASGLSGKRTDGDNLNLVTRGRLLCSGHVANPGKASGVAV